MSYKLFIDDERFPAGVGSSWVIVRSSEEAKKIVGVRGFPGFISFDHDLGGEDTSMIFINWMIDRVLNSMSTEMPIMNFPRSYYVHSQNPIGVKNINGLMDSFIKYLEVNQ